MDGSNQSGGSQIEPERRSGGALSSLGIPEVNEEALGETGETTTSTVEREDPGHAPRVGGTEFFPLHSRIQYHGTSAAESMAKKTWSFDAGEPLTCIATSNFFPLIAIAGRNLLQVLRVDDDKFVSVSSSQLINILFILAMI